MKMSVLWGVAAALLVSAGAARVGDEQFGNVERGYFVTFAAERIDVVDPTTGLVVDSVEPGQGTESWGDAVFIRSATDDGPPGGFVVAADMTNDDMVVLRVETDGVELIDRVPMGARPVHVYAVFYRNEVWAHADEDGTFDVLAIDDTSQLLKEEFRAHVEEVGHGKLLFDPDLGDLAFGTNVAEDGVFEIDLESKEHVGDTPKFFNFTELNDEGAVCVGTHGIAYSKVNRHLYVECIPVNGTGGTFEFSIDEERVVAVFANAKGVLFNTPDETHILNINRAEEKGNLFYPGKSGEPSNLVREFDIPGGPSGVAFIPNGEIKENTNVTDWLAFFSLVADDPDTGMAWIDFEDVVESDPDDDVVAEVISLGQVNGTRRVIKRGGRWVATPVHFPTSSLAIVDSETKELSQSVTGIGNVTRIVYVPLEAQ